MSPRKRQYRFCSQCGAKFILPEQSRHRRPRATCSLECQKKLIRLNYRNWSDRELQILSDMAETMPIIQLIRAFNQQLNQLGLQKRTQHSIRSKLQKLGFSANVQHGVYTVGMISKKLGVPFATVSTWTRYHGLRFYRVTKKQNATKYITAKHLRDFARKRPHSFGGIPFIDLYLVLEDQQLTEYIVKNYPHRPGRLPPQPVRCIETRKIYASYVEAGKAFHVCASAIFKSVKFGHPANEHHFEKVENPPNMPRVQAHLNQRHMQQQPI